MSSSDKAASSISAASLKEGQTQQKSPTKNKFSHGENLIDADSASTSSSTSDPKLKIDDDSDKADDKTSNSKVI